VNHTQWAGGGDANPDDGVCANAAGQCTLRAAIHEANALNGSQGDVLIRVADSIGAQGANTPMTGAVNQAGNRMSTASNSFQSSGATFHITAPGVTIDLDNRLAPNAGGNDTGELTLFFVDAPRVQLLNIGASPRVVDTSVC